MDKDKALQLALDFLMNKSGHGENCSLIFGPINEDPECTCGLTATKAAIRTVLAQPAVHIDNPPNISHVRKLSSRGGDLEEEITKGKTMNTAQDLRNWSASAMAEYHDIAERLCGYADSWDAQIVSLKAEHAFNMRERNDLFDAIAKLIDFNVTPYWNKENKEQLDKYRQLKNEAKLQMMDFDYCFRCRSIGCSGDCEIE